MSDETAPTTDTEAPPTAGDTPPTAPADGQVDWQAEAEKWKTFARKHEDRAKTNERAVKELEQFKKANQTEHEKAVDAAKATGRAEAVAELGSKIVDAEVRAAGAGRLSAGQLSALLEGLDRTRFLTDSGDVDADKVSKLVDQLAPKAEPSANGALRPDFGQGRRETVQPSKAAAGRAEALRRFPELGTKQTT